jgi:2,4-diaminopentanoate dehydrogenase
MASAPVPTNRGVVTAPYRVIQWGTGNTGVHALRFLLQDSSFDVVGVWVSRERNVGRAAGEIVGLDQNGPNATSDVDSLVALDADCVVYMPAEPKGSLNRVGSDGWQSIEVICRLLASGKNVVSTGISGLTNPTNYGPQVYDRLRVAAESGRSTFFTTGIEPGFMCDALALSFSSVSRDIRSIRTQEIISYATYDQPNYHVSQGGIWGAPADGRFAESFASLVLAAGMGAPVRLLADALHVELDDVTALVEFAPAEQPFDVPMGPIAPGTIAGYRFEVLGLVDSTPVIAVEHVTRIDPSVAPAWPSLEPGGFRVLLEGTPSYTVEVAFNEDDPNIAACTGTAARAVNAIPIVCRALPGVWSFLDLPMISAAGSVG